MLKIVKIKYPIMDFFLFILKIISKLFLNTIYKSLKVIKIFLKKDFKLKLSYEKYLLTFMIILMLSLRETYIFIEE